VAKETEVPDVIDQGRAAKGTNTATGVEEEARSGAQDERLEGTKKDHTGLPGTEDIKPDFLEGQAPQGLQAEPARFVTNGSLEPNMVASNSGPVPASAANFTPEAGEAAVEAQIKAEDDALRARFEQRQEIDEETISRMSAAEIRAVASDRGYTELDGIMGRKQSRSAFLTAQKADKSIKRKK
jgi:hypothetical protein